MLTLLPCFLLLLIYILVQIISRSKLNVGNQWLILVLSVVFAWGVMLFLRSYLPQPLIIHNWLPAAASVAPITIQLDETSWAFSFALLSLLAGMILVDTIRLHERTDIREWSRIILLSALGLVGCLMNSLLAFILCWTLIDIVALVVQTAGNKDELFSARIVTVFFLHLIGTFLVLVVLVKNQAIALDSASFNSSDLALLITGAGLRMVFFNNELITSPNHSQTGLLESLRKMVSPFLAIVFMSRIQTAGELPGIMKWFLAFAILLVLFAAIKWFKIADPIKGEGYTILFLSGLSIISVLRGQPEGTVVCGFLMPILVGWPRLYSFRFHKMHSFLLIFCATLVGLPFTFSSHLADTLAGRPLFLLNPLLWLSLSLLLAGIIRVALKTPNTGRSIESWMKMFYVIGLVLVTVTPMIASLWEKGSGNRFQLIWVSTLIIGILALILVFTLLEKPRKWLDSSIPAGIKTTANVVEVTSEKLVDSGWPRRIINISSGSIKGLINSTNTILEGDGGILWAFVFLALMLSLLISSIGG